MGNNNQGNYKNISQDQNNQSQGRFGEGSNQEPQNTWTCPNCETINTEEICLLCGYRRMNNTQKKTTSKIRVIGIIACILIVGAVLFVYSSNSRKYDRACAFLSQEQYEQASRLFESLGTYQDSQSQYQQATYKWAQSLLEENKYDKALEKLDEIPNYGKTANLVKEVHYKKGLAHLEEKEYADAYSELSMVPVDYKRTESKLYTLKVAWGKHIIDNALSGQAANFANTVSLTEKESRELYKYLINKKYDSWDYDGLNNGGDFYARRMILNTLTGEYTQRDTLKKLFNEFTPNSAEDFIKDNKELLSELWDTPVVQSIITHDWNMTVWLLGDWKTKNGAYNRKYYMNFYYKDGDSETIWCDYNLPWVEEPVGTIGYNIIEQEWCWIDKNDNELEKVYRFKLLDPNSMEVYCYVNGETYTVYRME